MSMKCNQIKVKIILQSKIFAATLEYEISIHVSDLSAKFVQEESV